MSEQFYRHSVIDSNALDAKTVIFDAVTFEITDLIDKMTIFRFARFVDCDISLHYIVFIRGMEKLGTYIACILFI